MTTTIIIAVIETMVLFILLFNMRGNCIANILPPILKTKNFFGPPRSFKIIVLPNSPLQRRGWLRFNHQPNKLFQYFKHLRKAGLVPCKPPLTGEVWRGPYIIVDLFNSIFSLLIDPGILPAT